MTTALPTERKRSTGKRVERYADSTGLEFEDVRAYMETHFGLRTADWPTAVRVDDPKVCVLMHGLFHQCWECQIGYSGAQWDRRIEAHHLCAGIKGRSDELTAIAMLCAKCHRTGTKEVPLARCLYLKHKFDKQHLSWVRLSLLNKQFLPDLIADEVE